MKQRSGLTFVELMIAMGLMAAIVLAVGIFTDNGFKLWRATRQKVDIEDKVRNALLQMTKEIRELKPADTGAFAIESATNQQFVFFANVDTDIGTERVRYFYQNETIKRGVINPTGSPATYPAASEIVTTVVDHVLLVGDVFDYYDQNYTGTQNPLTFPVDPKNIHLIAIHFQIDVDPVHSPGPTDVQTQITPRNLKDYAPANTN